MEETNWSKFTRELSSLNLKHINSFELKDSTLDFFLNYKGTNFWHKELAGHLETEIKIDAMPDEVVLDILGKCEYPIWKEYLDSFAVLTSNRPFVLDSCWINKQKKHEFNPIHTHSGLMSFVIFAQIPYKLEDEDKVFPEEVTIKATSRLTFLYINGMGQIQTLEVPVDKSFEGKMIMFDAKTPHCVYPFYTSEGERITVSGNIKLLTN